MMSNATRMVRGVHEHYHRRRHHHLVTSVAIQRRPFCRPSSDSSREVELVLKRRWNESSSWSSSLARMIPRRTFSAHCGSPSTTRSTFLPTFPTFETTTMKTIRPMLYQHQFMSSSSSSFSHHLCPYPFRNHSSRLMSSNTAVTLDPVLLHYDWVTEAPSPVLATPTNDGKSANAAAPTSAAHLVVGLHGLLGNGRNIRTLVKTYCQALLQDKQHQASSHQQHSGGDSQQQQQQQQQQHQQQHNVYGLTMDLRGHGGSASGSFPPTMQACVQDVHATLESLLLQLQQQQTPHAGAVPTFSSMTLLGHSWGGRVALQYTHDYYYSPSNVGAESSSSLSSSLPLPPLLHETWMLDSAPGGINESVLQVLEVVQELEQGGVDSETMAKLKTTSQWTQYLMDQYAFSTSLAQWLASSIDHKRLKQTAATNTTSTTTTSTSTTSIPFVFDTRVAVGLLPEFAKQNVLDMLQPSSMTIKNPTTADQHGENNDGPHLHVVRAGNNSNWTPDILERLKYIEQTNPRVHVHVLPNTGHWLHVEDLKGLVQLMIQKDK